MSIKYVLALIVLFLASTDLFAQNTISGSVRDKEKGEVLSEISIYFTDLKIGTTSDKDRNQEHKKRDI